ncbi:MAG: hypothetical protein KDC46_09025 [Thermoleophilia bacterium]|nr:hypothetical protein [Thermoleophilia bacterium]
MQRTSAWLTLVVAAALAAGIIAFLAASPNQDARVSTTQLGFGTLDRDWFDARIHDAAAAQQRENRLQVRERTAVTVTRRWLGALPGASTRNSVIVKGVAVAGETPEAASRIAALRTWSDGILDDAWHVAGGQATSVADSDSWTVSTELQVTLAHALRRTRTLRFPVVVQVAPPVAAGKPWRVRDVQVDSTNTSLRAWRDPVVVRSAAIDVVAATTARDDAVTVASTVAQRMRAVHALLPTLARVDTTTVWIVASAGQRRAALGSTSSGPDAAHPIAHLTTSGDLVVELGPWRSATPAEQRAALAHATFHATVLDALSSLSPILAEGAAMGFGSDPTDSELQTALTIPTDPADSIARLLVAPGDSALDEPARQRAHALGSWLLDVHGASTLRELVALRGTGIDMDHAIRRVLHATPAGIDATVRRWAAGGATASDSGDQTDDAADTGETTGDAGSTDEGIAA